VSGDSFLEAKLHDQFCFIYGSFSDHPHAILLYIEFYL